MRRILILGASLMQKPAIMEAKKLGCYVVAVDANVHAFCVDMVDRFERIDLKDVPSLIKFAKELQDNGGLSGVFTAATDFSASVAAITEALNLKGHSLEASLNASDKARMRAKFLQHNIPSPNFIEVGSDFSPILLSSLSYPLVVKPVDNMGARGCVLVHDDSHIMEAVQKASMFSRSKRVIVEEFIEGPEFSIEGLIFDGKVYITALADRHIFFSPYFVEMGHTIPSNFPSDIQDEVVSVFVQGVKALGLTHGACKGDIFFDVNKKKAVIGEIAARLSGGYMSGWTVPYSSGINITGLALKLALGEKISEEIPFPTKYNTKTFASERAWISIPGEVSEVLGLQSAKTSDSVKDIFPRVKEGDRVVFPSNNVEKCGNVISVASTYENAIRLSKNAIKNIFIRLKPKDRETDDFISSINLINQETYPPNYFIFPSIKDSSLMNALTSSNFVVEDGIVYPLIFKDYLDFEREPFGISIREAMEKAFLIEPKLKDKLFDLAKNRNLKKEKLINYWLSFIRGGMQGLIYWFDSYNNDGENYE